MPSKCRGSESSYAAGCRCDLCKRAAADARRERRRREREAVGELDPADMGGRPLVSIPECGPSTSDYLHIGVVEAVSLEIDGLGANLRPGLAAAALALARILDNPRAVSTQPAAAAQLVNILGQLRKSASGAKPKLAAVRQMTKNRGG